MTNLAVFGGAFFTPILVGKITHTIGWPWTFYLVAIFTAVLLPAVIFFVPETAYHRAAYLNIDMASSDDIHLFQKTEDAGHEMTTPNPGTTDQAVGESSAISTSNIRHRTHPDANTPKKTFVQNLMPFSGRKTDENFFKLLIRPFPLFAHPAVMWACLIQGTMIGWTVFLGIILAAFFLGPPLFWNEVKTGYAYTGPFVGAIFGFLIAGALADWSAKYLTRKNKGIYEPEFRILLVIPQLLIGCTGLFLFGVTAPKLSIYHWSVPIIAFGMEVCGMVIGAVSASLYIVDAHSKLIISLQ